MTQPVSPYAVPDGGMTPVQAPVSVAPTPAPAGPAPSFIGPPAPKPSNLSPEALQAASAPTAEPPGLLARAGNAIANSSVGPWLGMRSAEPGFLDAAKSVGRQFVGLPSEGPKEEPTYGPPKPSAETLAASATPAGGVPSPFMGAKAGGAGGGGAGGIGSGRDYYELGAGPTGRIGKEYKAADLSQMSAEERLQHAEQVKAELEARRQAELADAHVNAELDRKNGYELAQKHLNEIQTGMKADDDRIRQAQIDLANDKIDPDHIYGDHKTAGKLLAGLGMAFGAYGASLGHHANFAQEYIKDAIDRDIDAQKANHAAKAAKVQGYINNYDRHRMAGMDSIQAEAAAREDLYKQALAMGDAHAEKSGSAIYRQNWNVNRAAHASDAAKAEQERVRQQNAAGYARLQQMQAAAAAGAKPSAIDEAVAKANLENDRVASAAQTIQRHPEGDLPGYGIGGRLLHAIDEHLGTNLQTSEGKETREAVEALRAHRLKAEGARVTPDALDASIKHVVDEEDARRAAAEEVHQAQLQQRYARAGLLGKGGAAGSGGVRGRSLDDPERESDE